MFPSQSGLTYVLSTVINGDMLKRIVSDVLLKFTVTIFVISLCFIGRILVTGII